MSTQFSLYDQGNVLFTHDRYEEALKVYSEALQLSCCRNPRSILTLKLYLNRALCYLKLRCYNEAFEDCSTILSNDFERKKYVDVEDYQVIIMKAHVRRAIACEYLGDYEKGLNDLNAVLATSDPNMKALVKSAVDLHNRLTRLVSADRAAASAEGRPQQMLSSFQTLRLNFAGAIPEIVHFGEAISVKLSIGNEFGLWDRRILERSDAVLSEQGRDEWNRVDCSVLVLEQPDLCSPVTVSAALHGCPPHNGTTFSASGKVSRYTAPFSHGLDNQSHNYSSRPLSPSSCLQTTPLEPIKAPTAVRRSQSCSSSRWRVLFLTGKRFCRCSPCPSSRRSLCRRRHHHHRHRLPRSYLLTRTGPLIPKRTASERFRCTHPVLLPLCTSLKVAASLESEAKCGTLPTCSSTTCAPPESSSKGRSWWNSAPALD